MLKEMDSNEMMKVNGGIRVFVDGILYDLTKATIAKIASMPYTRVSTRGGVQYIVTYDGNWRP